MKNSRRNLLNEWLNIGLSWKIIKIRTTPLFFKIDLCSATSMESSRRDLLNDMAKHKPILKNYQNTYHPRYAVSPKTRSSIPQHGGFVFTELRCVMSLVLDRNVTGRWNNKKDAKYFLYLIGRIGIVSTRVG